MQHIELLFYVSDDIASRISLLDIAKLTKDLKLAYVSGRIEISVRIISEPKILLAVLDQKFQDSRGAACIVISDQLIADGQQPNRFGRSEIAKQISNLIKKNGASCGLIALTPNKVPTIQDIDACIFFENDGNEVLRESLETIIVRLWYKNPPVNLFLNGSEHLYSIEIVPIANERQLRDCFELRGRVYEALGYIEKSANHNPIEMDGYDRISWHFLALDRANRDRVAGTMRLIIPGQLFNPGIDSVMLEKWMRNIANSITAPRPQISACIQALPILAAFEYFEDRNRKIPDDGCIAPRNICEMSRVIVAPEYRGMGISRLLVNHAIARAVELRRQYLWLECAPHHIRMYQKFGFITKECEGECFYKRAQRLDTWAVAMHRNLEDPQAQSHRLPREAVSTSALTYLLPIRDGRAKNCILRFQFANQSVQNVEQVFDRPVPLNRSNAGQVAAEPLKTCLPSSLSSLDMYQFVKCLKEVVEQGKPEKLSLLHRTGRLYEFNQDDIKCEKREKFEDRLKAWLA